MLLKYFKSFALSALIGSMAFGFTACDDDDDELPGSGIETAQWSAVNDADLKGQLLIYEFEAPSNWTATSNQEWCEVLTPSGYSGTSSLRLKVAPNDGKLGRSAEVTVKINGYAEPCVLIVRQGEGVVEKGEGRFRDVNAWTFDIMKQYYLWNEPVADLLLDYSLDYDQFLTQMLDGVAESNDVNHDDGMWQNGQRVGYYSNIQSNAPLSRSAGESYSDAGLAVMPTILGANDDAPCGFAVMYVTPGTAADQAGVRRGDFISKVNNIAVTQSNYQSLGNSLLNGNVTVDLNTVEFNNGVATVTTRVASVQIGRTTYVDPAIYKSTVITANNGKKIGYLLYMNFHMDYDSQLLEIFNQFKAEGVSELIIDLRYNNGGHVLSSTVLGTLVAGQAHQGQTYLRTTYNAARTAAGEVGVYNIGEAANPETSAGYEPIAQALNSALNLSHVYVIGTENTASASELLINGLRGLDIDVRLIGTTTQGKNSGMEGWQKRAGSYNFVLYPITFYCENAKGFRDYADGFKPNFEFDDSQYFPGDFGTTDDRLSYIAIYWAANGNKPSLASAPASRAAASGVHMLKPSKQMKAAFSRNMGGSRTIVKEM